MAEVPLVTGPTAAKSAVVNFDQVTLKGIACIFRLFHIVRTVTVKIEGMGCCSEKLVHSACTVLNST